MRKAALILGYCHLLLIQGANASPAICADLTLHSGKILTVNESFDVAEAMAVYDGKVLALGANEDIARFAGQKTRRIDLDGKTVIPGFIDSHSHPTAYGMTVVWPDLSGAKEISDIVTTIEQHVSEAEPGEWITNSRFWNEENLKEKRNPTRFDLDPVSPKNPVFLSRGHLGIANSVALRALGISKDTPDPEGGSFERDPQTGELTGRMYETAMDPFREALPSLTQDQVTAAQQQSYEEMAAAGVTSVRSAGFGAGDSGSGLGLGAELRGFLELKRQGKLKLRTSVSIRLDPNLPAGELEEFFRRSPVASGLGDEMLRIWGIKLIADGGSDLAYLRQEYKNRPGFRGQLGGTHENFVRTSKLANKYGWRVGTHALGDAAIDFTLDVYEEVNEAESIVGERWSIEHGYFLRPEHYPRIKKLGLILNPQTWHFYNLYKNFLENYGREYADMTHPYRTILDNDIRMAGGMDWFLDPGDMFFYMNVEMSRKTEQGKVVAPEQSLTREEALRFHTVWPAYMTFEEDKKGSLETGKYADFVILSDDYMAVPQEKIKDIVPLATYVGGELVFQKSDY